MSTQQARELVFETLGAVAPEVDPEQLDPSGPLRDQADLDSMDFLEVVARWSEAIGEDIPESDYGQLETLDSAVAYIAGRML